MEEILQSILDVVKPDGVWDYFIYGSMLFSIITLALIPDGNNQAFYLILATLFLGVVDLIRDATTELDPALFGDKGFVTMLMHVGMAIFPIIAAAVIRGRPKDKSKVMPIAGLTGLIGIVYTVGFQLLVTGS